MFSFAKIIGDLFQGYVLKAASIVVAVLLASDVYAFLRDVFGPISKGFTGQ